MPLLLPARHRQAWRHPLLHRQMDRSPLLVLADHSLYHPQRLQHRTFPTIPVVAQQRSAQQLRRASVAIRALRAVSPRTPFWSVPKSDDFSPLLLRQARVGEAPSERAERIVLPREGREREGSEAALPDC